MEPGRELDGSPMPDVGAKTPWWRNPFWWAYLLTAIAGWRAFQWAFLPELDGWRRSVGFLGLFTFVRCMAALREIDTNNPRHGGRG